MKSASYGIVLRSNRRGRRGHDRMIVGFSHASSSYRIDVVSSNLDQVKVYNIMSYSLSVTCNSSEPFSGSFGLFY